MGAMERIRAELDVLKADLETPSSQRSRILGVASQKRYYSMPPVPTSPQQRIVSNGYDQRIVSNGYDQRIVSNGYDQRIFSNGYDQRIVSNGYDVVRSPVVTVAPTVAPMAYLPAPPLPPVSSELYLRLDALEAQRIAAEDAAYDRQIDQLSSKLAESKAFVAKQEGLELQLWRCNVEWEERVALLEARMREHQSGIERRINEVVRGVEMRGQEEVEQLELQMEAARAASRRSRDDFQRQLQEEIDLLGGKLQAARRAQWSLEEQRQSQDADMERLQAAYKAQSVEVRRIDAEIARYEELIRDLNRQLQEERSSSSRDFNFAYLEVNITRSRDELEDLRKELAAAEANRDLLRSDFQHMKKALDNRAKEAENLREALQEERKNANGIKAEIEDCKNRRQRMSIAEERSARVSNVSQVVTENVVQVSIEDNSSDGGSSYTELEIDIVEKS